MFSESRGVKPKEQIEKAPETHGLTQETLKRLWMRLHPDFRQEVGGEEGCVRVEKDVLYELLLGAYDLPPGLTIDMGKGEWGAHRVTFDEDAGQTVIDCEFHFHDYGDDSVLRFALQRKYRKQNGIVSSRNESDQFTLEVDPDFVHAKLAEREAYFAQEEREAEERAEIRRQSFKALLAPRRALVDAGESSPEDLAARGTDPDVFAQLKKIYGDSYTDEQYRSLRVLFLHTWNGEDREPDVYEFRLMMGDVAQDIVQLHVG